MPQFVRSALNPGGSYQADAMDQVEQWNANRGDQWSRYALEMMQRNQDIQRQQAQDDWRKEVALKQLGLQSDMWKGGREDAAAARQADAERWKQQFSYMTGRDTMADERIAARDAMEAERWNKQFGQGERLFNLQMGEAEARAAERAAEREGLKKARTAFGSKFGLDADTSGALPMEIVGRGLAQPLINRMEDEERTRRESQDAVRRIEAGDYAGAKELAALKALASKGGMNAATVGQGQMVPAEQVKAQAPEYNAAVDSIRQSVKGLSGANLQFGGEADAGAYVQSQIESNARAIAEKYGTDPVALSRIMAADVMQNVEGVDRGLLNKFVNKGAEWFTGGQVQTQREAALEALANRYQR